MKKLSIFLYLLFAAGICHAQTDDTLCPGDIYYRNGEQITAGDITFKVERMQNYHMRLKNVNNHWLDETCWYYEDGTPLETEEEMNAIKFSLNDRWMHIRVMKEIFTPEEIAVLGAEQYSPLTLYCSFDSSGVLQEVSFSFKVLEPLVRMSPDRFALIEKRLKEQLKVRFHPTSPKVQFVTLSVDVYFRDWDGVSTESRPPAPEN